MSVPVDTLGHPLPPPCLAGDRITCPPPIKWQEWWQMYLSNSLPKEYPCCVCGGWFGYCHVTECQRAHLHRKAKEVINTTLNEIYVCRQCKTTCPECKATITRFQRERFNGCDRCTP